MHEEIAVAKRYADHPKYIAPAHIMGTIAVHLPVLMLGSVYSLTVSGFFSIAYRMVSLPSSLVANAIGDVYRQRISAAYNEQGEFRSIFVVTLTKTTLLSLLPFIAYYFIAPFFFERVFGAAWSIAGEYAQILVVGAFFQFIFTPTDKGAVVVGANRYILIWNIVRMLSFIILFYASNRFSLEIISVLWYFVLVNSILYIFDGIVEYRFSKKIK